MTGWQTAEGHGPSFSQQHQEAMELSKVISQLAMANQQLASAHTATLAHLEALYMELAKEKELRRRAVSSETLDDALKKRLTIEDDRDYEVEEKRQRMEARIDRLENLLTNDWDTCQYGQRDVRQEEDRKLRARIERLEAMAKFRGLDRGDERQRFTNVCDSVEIQDTGRRQTNDLPCDRLANSVEVPEFNTQCATEETISRISVADEEDLADSRLDDAADRAMASLHLENSKEVEYRAEDENGQSLGELERLKAELAEYQGENERLVKDLEEQRTMVSQLTKDCEVNFIVLARSSRSKARSTLGIFYSSASGNCFAGVKSEIRGNGIEFAGAQRGVRRVEDQIRHGHEGNGHVAQGDRRVQRAEAHRRSEDRRARVRFAEVADGK